MNIDQIIDLPLGNEMNGLIVQHALGYVHYLGVEVPGEHMHEGEGVQEVWIKEIDGDVSRFCRKCGNMPDYSRDQEAALELLDRVKDNFDVVSLIYCNGSWECGFTPLDSMEQQLADVRYDSPVISEAICRALLLATMLPHRKLGFPLGGDEAE